MQSGLSPRVEGKAPSRITIERVSQCDAEMRSLGAGRRVRKKLRKMPSLPNAHILVTATAWRIQAFIARHCRRATICHLTSAIFASPPTTTHPAPPPSISNPLAPCNNRRQWLLDASGFVLLRKAVRLLHHVFPCFFVSLHLR